MTLVWTKCGCGGEHIVDPEKQEAYGTLREKDDTYVFEFSVGDEAMVLACRNMEFLRGFAEDMIASMGDEDDEDDDDEDGTIH